MFVPKEFLSGMLHRAPPYLLQRVPSVLLGLTAGYCSVLLLFGPFSFFYGFLQLLVTVTIAYALAVTARLGIERGSVTLQQLMGVGQTTADGASFAAGEERGDRVEALD